MNLKIAPAKNLLEDLADILSGNTKKYSEGGGQSDGIAIGEQLLGTLEDPIARALWNFGAAIAKGLNEDVETTKTEVDRDDKMLHEKIWRTMDSAVKIAQICRTLFMIRVRMSFPMGHHQGITLAIRNGWKVVAMKSANPPIGFSATLFGTESF